MSDDLQCGRIYKDAEIRLFLFIKSGAIGPFNVAASIKMRKFTTVYAIAPKRAFLQCGRIYKDAEIRIMPYDGQSIPEYLQCGRIYKDAEIYTS